MTRTPEIIFWHKSEGPCISLHRRNWISDIYIVCSLCFQNYSPNLNTEMWRNSFFPIALILKALLDFYSYLHFARGAVKDIPGSLCTWKTACTGSFYLFFFFSPEDTEQCFVVNGGIRSYSCELLVCAVRLVINTQRVPSAYTKYSSSYV